MSSMQNGFIDNLVKSARENPLAAALIGGGAFWLLAGNESLKKAASSATAAASSLADVAARNRQAAGSRLERTASPPTAPEMDRHIGENLRSATSAAVESRIRRSRTDQRPHRRKYCPCAGENQRVGDCVTGQRDLQQSSIDPSRSPGTPASGVGRNGRGNRRGARRSFPDV